MKILVYDVDFRSSGVMYPIKDAIEVNGHIVDMFDWRKYLYTYDKVSFIGRIQNKIFYDFITFQINKDLKNVIKKGNYDLFLVVRGERIYPDTLIFAKKFIPKIVNWSSDDLFNMLNSSKYILESINLYDIHFSPRKHLKEEYLSKGAKKFEIIDWYYRPQFVQEKTPINNINYINDICFIGSWSSRREHILMSSFDGLDLKVYGWGWEKKVNQELFPNITLNKEIRMVDMMSLFTKSKININIFTIENRDRTNLRNFEISVVGGFQISERSEDLLSIFEEDQEIVCFSSIEELHSKSVFYLKNDTLREKIALAGYNKIINGNNTLLDRVNKIIEIVNKH